MNIQLPLDTLPAFSSEQLLYLKKITSDCNTLQLAWLSGYFWGMANKIDNFPAVNDKTISSPLLENTNGLSTITLISASQTGNARRLALKLYNDLLKLKLKVKLINAGDYKFIDIVKEKFILLIISTYGQGEPPEEAIMFYDFLMSKKVPPLKNIKFAVFGLGDSSYDFFNKAAKDFDNRFAELGAERLLERVDADIQYNEKANIWIKTLEDKLQSLLQKDNYSKYESIIPLKKNNSNNTPVNQYNRENPFTATVLVNQKITGRYSNKDIRHIEIDISNSGLNYQPGDALGIWYENDELLVKEFIEILELKGNQYINVKGKKISLFDQLIKHLDLTVNSPSTIKKYLNFSKNKILVEIANDNVALHNYAKKVPIIDMIRQAPAKLNIEELMSLLRPIRPRLYSISSAQSEINNEVHITVNVISYKVNGRKRGGGASTWLSTRNDENNNKISIFIEKNTNFRLPTNLSAPIIMIGAGTGIAPFRAFMQQRNHDNTKAKNWLFFGNEHFTEDFLYQVEWQKYTEDGLLTKIDLAWSRDQINKIYIQHKMYEKSLELWNWIQDGAHIYVCGNANKMAKDVEQALLNIIVEKDKKNIETAKQFLNDLRINRRYQRDIY